MKDHKIVETDNFGGDYPNEKFLNLPLMTGVEAAEVAATINEVCSGDNLPRFWKAVNKDYVLQPGFEP